MRKKIKQLMNKEEGFTLVELLAVIVILGLIIAIAVPSIGTLIDGATDDADAANNQMILDAARLYDIEIKSDDTLTWAVGASKPVSELVTKGYLDARENTNITDESTTPIWKTSSGFTLDDPAG